MQAVRSHRHPPFKLDVSKSLTPASHSLTEVAAFRKRKSLIRFVIVEGRCCTGYKASHVEQLEGAFLDWCELRIEHEGRGAIAHRHGVAGDVARSASSDWKLCTGKSSSVRLCYLAFGGFERHALATMEARAASRRLVMVVEQNGLERWRMCHSR